MVDIHTHILPGFDDGADEMAEAVEMARLAVEGGTRALAATPHSNQWGRFENYCSDALSKAFDVLEERLRLERIPLKLYRGMEIYASWDVAEKIIDGRLRGLGDSDYYLIEFPFDVEPEDMGNVLEAVLSAGKIPMIAHPERYSCIQHHPMILYQWMAMGCLSQINKGSIFGRFGRGAAKTAEILLDFELVTCIASDAHSSVMRTTYMGDIRTVIGEQYDMAYAKLLLSKHPEMVLENREIPFTGRLPVQKKRFFR